ncbi:MAG TPA: GTPase HflX [Anaerolineae bacterium]|nr:GTPase HflX [Anaerolineae bacterium]
MLEIKEPKERAVLVGLEEDYGGDDDLLAVEPLEELRLLTETAGAEVVGTVTQSRSSIDPRYFIGKGKALELKDKVQLLGATTVIFDNDLSPAQVSNHEKLLEVKVIDRAGLILDIFALRARTSQAKTQVELAQLKHLLPRLTRQWTHLSRQVGGIGVRGPGETQLEVDRRRVRNRITHLTDNLKKIEKRGIVSRKKRKTSFNVTLVGYTNAGKSTLFNVVSRASAPVENKLFKTLDSTTRALKLENTPIILLSDTVGFIRNLPHELIASFKSTLDDVRNADLLLHVIDITNSHFKEQLEVVENVLEDIDSSGIDTILVFNKIDLIENPTFLKSMRSRYTSSVFVSAKNRTGIEELKHSINVTAMKKKIMITMEFGPEDSNLMRDVYRYGTILDTFSNNNLITLTFIIPVSIAHRLGFSDKYVKK